MEELGKSEIHGRQLDRNLKTGAYLEKIWLPAKKDSLSSSTFADYAEIVQLYLVPGLGHLKLVDLRDKHVIDLYEAILQINRPLPEGDKPGELLRRLLEVRAYSTRPLKVGEAPRRKQTKPISPTRVKKIHAVLLSALNWAVKSKRLRENPIAHVGPPRVKGRRVKPLVWTAERVERWRETGKVPVPVMVWTPAQTGAFLDFIAEERLYALFHLVAFRGLRRAEVAGLAWADTDLQGAGTLTVRETSPDSETQADEYDDTKSEAGERTVALDEATIAVLLDWRSRQERERSVAGPEVWVDSGRVFTREDGTRLRPQWISTRFEDLIRKYGLVQHRHSEEGWSVDRISRHHRTSVRAVQVVIGGEPLPPIRFHDLRHGAATLALLGNVNMKVISETLGHARNSFTADTYTSVLPEVSRAAAEAVAAVVPRRPRPETPAAGTNVISFADRRSRRDQHAG
ncbi:tyrosine-type recombinase/integrase [Actinomadura bangladeshensis]|uniref:Site-specific integrase n=1 Tax=Actinomadura bangladeshensis TaxID=453573 RepID=A0A6L9Q9K9_9ACTN|nr:tyrosine-type recombinase/integrase [Actinomadura bangladeshensis]NEA22199.1 site-specific integrase [Actinomadura bangladeshensis]